MRAALAPGTLNQNVIASGGGGGCVPVTDAVIYTGGAEDPSVAEWTAFGGTLAQVGNNVLATGSITDLFMAQSLNPAPMDGVIDLTPIGSCLTNCSDQNFTTNYTGFGATPILSILELDSGIVTITANPAQAPLLQYLIVNTNFTTTMDCTGWSELLQIAGTNDGFNTFQFTALTITGCAKLASIALSNNALSQASVDNALIYLRDFGPTIVNVNFSGGTSSAPGVLGAAAKAALILRGGTVTTN